MKGINALKKSNRRSFRAVLITLIGVFCLAVGLFGLFTTPAELTSMFAFSEGSAFQYDGFGFGSLMFAFIILNMMAYGWLALLFIPLGIGNLKKHDWGYHLSIICLKAFLLVGCASVLSVLLSFDLYHILNPYQMILLVACAGVLLTLVFCLLRFYRNSSTMRLFAADDLSSTEKGRSVHKGVILLLNGFWCSVFILFIFLQGAFPIWGRFVFLGNGVYLLSAAFFAVAVLSYLYYIDWKYAKYGMLVYCVLLLPTFVFSFFVNSTEDFIRLLHLPVYETENIVPLLRIPAGVNLGVFFGLIVVIQVLLLLLTKNENTSVVR